MYMLKVHVNGNEVAWVKAHDKTSSKTLRPGRANALILALCAHTKVEGDYDQARRST